MDQQAIDPNQFIHVRMVLSMVVSLALARLLSGVAKFVQHPKRIRIFAPHMLWCSFMLILLIHFWWWEFSLIHLRSWHFGTFAFVVGYAALLYLMCAILFPDDLAEYDGYSSYFMSRRGWFFAMLSLVMLIDLADTRLKGEAYWQAQAPEIWLHTGLGLVLCAAAVRATKPTLQVVVAALGIAYQVSWIARLYSVLR